MIDKELIKELLEDYNSFYLYDSEHIRNRVATLNTNFKQVTFLYSLKTNPKKEILDLVFQMGLGADAASLSEVITCHEHGIHKGNIQYSAPGKTKEDIEQSLGICTIIADSLSEIRLINQIAQEKQLICEIGIRINPNFTLGSEVGVPSKFGIDESQVYELISKIDEFMNVKIVGIHVHSRSQELNQKFILEYYRRLFELILKIQTQLGYELQFMNMGSGIGIPYRESDSPIDMLELGKQTSKLIEKYKQFYPDLQLYIESGRYIVGQSAVYVTKVLDKKKSHGKTYIILANTLNGFIRPSLAMLVDKYNDSDSLIGSEPLFSGKSTSQFYTTSDLDRKEIVDLVGNLCTATDVYATNIALPKLEIGDGVIVTNAGAYGIVLSPVQFANQKKPVEIWFDHNQ